jgi:predicted nucleic acid-binding Zn finger protein
LLIDFEHEDSNEKYKKIRKYEEEAESILTEKVGKSLSLERGFNNLGICKL